MASIGDLVANLSLNSQGFSRGARSAQSSLGSLASAVTSNVGGMIAQMTAMLGIGTALGSIGWGIKLAADAEQTQIAFEVMLGSAEKARTILGDLKGYADKSPFDVAGVNEAAKKLMNYGIVGADVLPTMKMLGDVASGDMDKFDRLSTAFGQMSSAGRLMGQDLVQFINAGFNPLQEISKKTGESMAALKKRMEDGGVSSAEVANAFKDATSEGGRFFGMTERQSKTAAGKFSTMKDGIASALREVGESILENLDVSGWMDAISDAVSKVPFYFRNAGPLIRLEVIGWQLYFEELVPGITQTTQDIGIIIQGVWIGLTAGFMVFIDNVKAGFKELMNLVEVAQAAANGGANQLQADIANHGTVGAIAHNMPDPLMMIGNALGLTSNSGFGNMADAAANAGTNKLAGQKDVAPPAKDPIQAFVDASATAIENLTKAAEQSGSLKDKLKEQQADLNWQIAESGDPGVTSRADLGAGKPPPPVDPKKEKADKADSKASLLGSSDAAKIFTAGIGKETSLKVATEQLGVLKGVWSTLQTGFAALLTPAGTKGITDGARKLGTDLLGSQAGGLSGIHLMNEIGSQVAAFNWGSVFGEPKTGDPARKPKPQTTGQARAARMKQDQADAYQQAIGGGFRGVDPQRLAGRIGSSNSNQNGADPKVQQKQLTAEETQVKLLFDLINQQPSVASF
jgi:tape measure domain-containing protein